MTHIWVPSDIGEHATVVRRYREHANVKFVEYGSNAYDAALTTSEYLVNNATFPGASVKRAGQKYVDTWHSTPLKLMGHDVEGAGPNTRNIVRHFLQADYLVAANLAMTEMYLRAYKLGYFYRGTINTRGYPRIDRQQTDQESVRRAKTDLATSGLSQDDRRISLLATRGKASPFIRQPTTPDNSRSMRGNGAANRQDMFQGFAERAPKCAPACSSRRNEGQRWNYRGFQGLSRGTRCPGTMKTGPNASVARQNSGWRSPSPAIHLIWPGPSAGRRGGSARPCMDGSSPARLGCHG